MLSNGGEKNHSSRNKMETRKSVVLLVFSHRKEKKNQHFSSLVCLVSITKTKSSKTKQKKLFLFYIFNNNLLTEKEKIYIR